MLRPLIAACVFAFFVGASAIAQAQSFGNTGSSAFGSSSFGSSSFGGGGFGSSSFGQSGFGSGGIGMGGGGMGSGGAFGSSGFGGMGSGSSSSGNQGIGGYGGGQSFVGRDSADMAATWNQLGQASTQFFNQMNRGTSRDNNRQQNTAETIENPPQKMRVNLQVAFTARRQSPVELANSIRTRLGQLLAEQNIVAPQFTMEGDVAVLGGVAATESQRLVLEKLIAMEPGVRAVRNEMTVVPPTATESLPAADD